jgi:hypothetical protein
MTNQENRMTNQEHRSLSKIIYMVLICASFAYVAFWFAYMVHGAMAEH